MRYRRVKSARFHELKIFIHAYHRVTLHQSKLKVMMHVRDEYDLRASSSWW